VHYLFDLYQVATFYDFLQEKRQPPLLMVILGVQQWFGASPRAAGHARAAQGQAGAAACGSGHSTDDR
jgi:hypothetical protein